MLDLFDDNTTEDLVQDTEESSGIPQEYEVDLDTGLMTGRIVRGSEAVRMWAWNALRTQRYRHDTHTWDFGSELETLIGQNYSESYTNSRAQKMVEDALLINPHISEITDFVCGPDGDALVMSFTIVTDFGEEAIETDVTL